MKKSDLFKQLNYLNMQEIRSFCKKHKIPFTIMFESSTGLKKSKDKDRKGIILDRIREYLKTGAVPHSTVYSRQVCSTSPLSVVRSNNRLHYGQYNKHNVDLMEFLKSLTGGKFKDGSVAREVMRDFWVSGHAPMLKEFAKKWCEESERTDKSHAEWAFLTDMSAGGSMRDWKQKRNKIAKIVIKELNLIKTKNK